jgi:hypothetical protein
MEKEFGNPENPLLLSVRSGAAISMPGMVRKDEYYIVSHQFADSVGCFKVLY